MVWNRKESKIKGSIGYFGLAEWWLSTFSDVEQEYIKQVYRPFFAGSDQTANLTQENVSFSSGTPGHLLWGLAGWFKKVEDFSIAKRLLEKAEELSANNPLDLHFTYSQKIEIFYRARDFEPFALDVAIKACDQQIAIAPQVAKLMRKEYPESPLPSHVGYKQLAIFYEKQKRYADAVQLCQQAKGQGWNGDWDKRADRCQKKINKCN